MLKMSDSALCESTFETDEGRCQGKNRLCIIGKVLAADKNLLAAIQGLNVPMVYSDDGHEFFDESPEYNTGFVVEDFNCEIFHELHKSGHVIFGPIAIQQYFQQNQALSRVHRPLYCTAMRNITICFTGFRVLDEMNEMCRMVHHMGGKAKRDFKPNSITHLVANSTSGDKYRYAVNLGKPVMSSQWIYKCWERRNDTSFTALDLALMEYKVQPFSSCSLHFYGFSAEEKQHMEEVAIKNGGQVSSIEDPKCTHCVVDEQTDCTLLPDLPKVHFVKAEWFWASIQIDARADEQLYLLKQFGDGDQSAKGTPNVYSTPESKGAKRRKLKDTLGHLACHTDMTRKSSDIAGLSISGSLLDATTSPDPAEKSGNDSLEHQLGPPVCKDVTPRQQVCVELLQTESNYVGIMHTIINVIKEPIEDVDQVGGPLLDPTEVKIIFGNLLPIYEVHCKLKENLLQLANYWREDNSIGQVILKHSQDLLKAYPPFVNFFEKTKEMLMSCDMAKPRFHAFLKICQGKPECGRQSLVELLIRPVQRLPSIVLLLSDILKHTQRNNPDHDALERAITSLKEVMTHINEDKRRTEGQVAMFDILNDIENCPANLLSSHRAFLTKAELIELSDGIGSKGDCLTMFLFTDVIEFCKKRKAGGVGSLRSPSLVSLQGMKNAHKCYKHLLIIPLSHIKRVVDIKETEECKNVFAFVCRSNCELKERLYTFTLVGVENKYVFLRSICRNIANTVCKADAEAFLTCVEPKQLDITSSDVATSTLAKAMKFASKTTRKVSRAFSFSKTPRLRRAVSTMMSPFDRTATPTSNLVTMQFPCASTSDLANLDLSMRTIVQMPQRSYTVGPASSSRK